MRLLILISLLASIVGRVDVVDPARSSELNLDENHCAIIGKSGSGKSYAAKGIVEGLLDRGERVCIVDPTGAWSGLKSKASGKSGAYPIVIFGGEHADFPLGQLHSATIAEIRIHIDTPAILAIGTR